MLCCCGVVGLLESDLCFLADHTHLQEMFNPVPGNESWGSFLTLCLSFAIFDSFYQSHLPPSISPSASQPYLFLSFKRGVFLSLVLIVSFSLSPSLTPLSLSLHLNHSVRSHTHTQRCMSGVIMDHVNAHETTRLESYCCRVHSEHTLLTLSNHIGIPLMPHSLSLS